MARFTRHELKQDEFRTTFEEFERFAKERYREILGVAGLVVVVVGLAAGLKLYAHRQEAEANAQLGLALKTFRSYVGVTSPGSLPPDEESFPTTQQKYSKALEQFADVTKGFPRTKAAALARYHMGLCQAQLGDEAGAIKTLEEAGRVSDREIKSLAQLALATELAKTGKLEQAAKLFQVLADHPTLTVPRATALMATADAYRTTQPAKSREIYERLQKEFGPDSALSEALKREISSLSR